MVFLQKITSNKKLNPGRYAMCKPLNQDAETRQLRRTLGQYPTGVAVVSAVAANGSPVGITINSFCSISLIPALVGWCIDRKSLSYDVFSTTQAFTLTVLSETQTDVAKRFAQRGGATFDETIASEVSPPAIPNGCAWFKCKTFNRFRLGDHLMLVGNIKDSQISERTPLVFYQGIFTHLTTVGIQPQLRTA